jgi:hypothetical protein
MRRPLSTLISLVLAALTPTLAAAQSTAVMPDEAGAVADEAGPKQEAKRRFEHAIKLYEEADYALALAEFERVYELVPDYRVLYNIGQVNLQLGRYARALLMLRQYLTRGGAELPAERRSAVQADLDMLSLKTATLEVVVRPDGADVALDGSPVGRSPLQESLVVDVGEHTLQVSATGYAPQSRKLMLAGGDRRPVSVELERATEPAPAAENGAPVRATSRPPVDLRPAPRATEKPRWLWVGWAGTGVLAAGSAVSLALGASSASHLADLRDTRGPSRAELEEAKSEAQTRLLVADVLGAAAITAGATMLYFQLSTPNATRDTRRSTAAWGVQVLPSGVALRVTH